MNLEEYLAKLWGWRTESIRGLSIPFALSIAVPWFDKIAPVKAREYGVECWLRLGAKGLIADTSACHYRWRSLREQGGLGDSSDVLLDAFGYAVMLNVVLGRETADWVVVGLDIKPESDNETVIRKAWDGDDYSAVGDLVLRQAFNQWRHRFAS
jgi:hypothetical protein